MAQLQTAPLPQPVLTEHGASAGDEGVPPGVDLIAQFSGSGARSVYKIRSGGGINDATAGVD
jgi:hypothetical protein